LGKRACRFCVLSLLFVAGGCGSYQDERQSITISVSPQRTAIGTGQSTQFFALGDVYGVSWSVVAFTSAGPGTAAPAGTIDASGNYTAPSGSQSLVATVTATSKTDPAKSSSATVNVVAPGQVTATNNVQVAQYTISPAASANVSVQFGTDTTYGLTTWTQPAGQFGGAVNLYVAGMKASTLYHMRGLVQFADGTQFTDADRTFTTGALPIAMLPTLTASPNSPAPLRPKQHGSVASTVSTSSPWRAPRSSRS